MAGIEDLSELRPSQLATAHRLAQELLGQDVCTARFRDGNAAVDAVSLVRQRLLKMYGWADLLLSESGEVSWQVDRPRVRPDAERPRVSPDPGARVSTTPLPTYLRLTVHSLSNPKRPGTRAWETFELYWRRDPDERFTGESFVARMVRAGYSRRLALSTLHWDIKRGFVSLDEESTVEQDC